MIRSIIFRLLYIVNMFRLQHVKMRGFCVIFSFKGSRISLGKGIINSSWTSNMLGLWQRTIIVARHGGSVEIGDNFGISGSTIYSTASVTIGKNVTIGANCKIIDNDFHPVDFEQRRLPINGHLAGKAPIVIGDDCFIGMNSIILKGSRLGDRVVVGAGSVVHGTFPDDCIIAGNPAKIIKRL